MKYRVLTGVLAFLAMGSINAQEQEQNEDKSLYIKGNALFIPIGILNAGIEKQISPKYTIQGMSLFHRGSLLRGMNYKFTRFL